MNDNRQKVGRLAMRLEGSFWCAYFALPDTMEGAILLGSVAARFVQTPERKKVFMDLMREALSDALAERAGGGPVTWDEPQAAPESERSGHG